MFPLKRKREVYENDSQTTHKKKMVKIEYVWIDFMQSGGFLVYNERLKNRGFIITNWFWEKSNVSNSCMKTVFDWSGNDKTERVVKVSKRTNSTFENHVPAWVKFLQSTPLYIGDTICFKGNSISVTGKLNEIQGIYFYAVSQSRFVYSKFKIVDFRVQWVDKTVLAKEGRDEFISLLTNFHVVVTWGASRYSSGLGVPKIYQLKMLTLKFLPVNKVNSVNVWTQVQYLAYNEHVKGKEIVNAVFEKQKEQFKYFNILLTMHKVTGMPLGKMWNMTNFENTAFALLKYKIMNEKEFNMILPSLKPRQFKFEGSLKRFWIPPKNGELIRDKKMHQFDLDSAFPSVYLEFYGNVPYMAHKLHCNVMEKFLNLKRNCNNDGDQKRQAYKFLLNAGGYGTLGGNIIDGLTIFEPNQNVMKSINLKTCEVMERYEHCLKEKINTVTISGTVDGLLVTNCSSLEKCFEVINKLNEKYTYLLMDHEGSFDFGFFLNNNEYYLSNSETKQIKRRGVMFNSSTIPLFCRNVIDGIMNHLKTNDHIQRSDVYNLFKQNLPSGVECLQQFWFTKEQKGMNIVLYCMNCFNELKLMYCKDKQIDVNRYCKIFTKKVLARFNLVIID